MFTYRVAALSRGHPFLFLYIVHMLVRASSLVHDASRVVTPNSSLKLFPCPLEVLMKSNKSQVVQFWIADSDGKMIVDLDTAGRPMGISLQVGPHGSTINGLMAVIGQLITLSLATTTLESVVAILLDHRFEPCGMTDDPEIRFSSSITDLIGRMLALEYLLPDDRIGLGVLTLGERLAVQDAAAVLPDNLRRRLTGA
jgi:hypothetical protein